MHSDVGGSKICTRDHTINIIMACPDLFGASLD